MSSVYDFSITGTDGKPQSLHAYKGKPLLIINLPLSSKQTQLSSTFDAARVMHNRHRNHIQVLGVPITSSSTPEERSIFTEYPVMAGLQVKYSFGSTVEPPLYNFLDHSMKELPSAASVSKSELRVDRLFLVFLINKSGKLVNVFQPDTSERVIDEEVKKLLGTFDLGSPNATGGAASGEPNGANSAEPSNEVLLRFIVDNVNELFQTNYSLVSFDELKGRKLLQLVNNVFSRLQPQLQADLSVSPLGEIVPQMVDFLTNTLGYKTPAMIQHNFLGAFEAAETTVIYPVLYWTLSRMEQNEKRVYLARFLQLFNVPNAMLVQDEDVRTLYEQYQSLRALFIPTHKRVEEMRKGFNDPQAARRTVATLEGERNHLLSYIRIAQKKVEHVPEKDALLAACRSLRLAQEEETKLAEKKVEQQEKKVAGDCHRAELANRLQHLQRDLSDGRADLIVRRLHDEAQTNRIKLEQQLPKEVERARSENAELRRLLTEPLDPAAYQNENSALDRDLKVLRAEVAERERPSEDGSSVATIHQQVTRVQGRKREIIAELTSLQAQHSNAVADVAKTEAHIAQLRTATQMLNGEEFKEFSQQVRAKRAATESMRIRISEIRAERGVLSFTESVLQEQYAELDRTIGDLENKLGMQGYSHTLDTLHRLTHEKDALEELKGKTLEELSKVSQEVVMLIRDRRTKIAPLINELRAVRDAAAELDREWEDKKSVYEYQESLLLEDVRKLTNDVNKLRAEAQNNESLYHRLASQRVLLKAQQQRVEDEKLYRSDPAASLDPQYKTHADYIADTIKSLESRTKSLQERRLNVEEHHEANTHQVQWFAVLRQVLEAKVKTLQSPPATSGEGGETSLDDRIKGAMGGAGVDLLVLNNN